MVDPVSHGVSRGPWYSGTLQESHLPFAYGAITRYGGPFQGLRLDKWFVTLRTFRNRSTHVPQPRPGNACGLLRQIGLGSSAFARRYWRNHFCFLFLGVLRWFTSPRWPLKAYAFSHELRGYCPLRLPDSEIPGSKPVCGSPRLIAAYRVLHRLFAPRHPPCALSSLTKSILE